MILICGESLAKQTDALRWESNSLQLDMRHFGAYSYSKEIFPLFVSQQEDSISQPSTEGRFDHICPADAVLTCLRPLRLPKKIACRASYEAAFSVHTQKS